MTLSALRENSCLTVQRDAPVWFDNQDHEVVCTVSTVQDEGEQRLTERDRLTAVRLPRQSPSLHNPNIKTVNHTSNIV